MTSFFIIVAIGINIVAAGLNIYTEEYRTALSQITIAGFALCCLRCQNTIFVYQGLVESQKELIGELMKGKKW